VDIVVAGSLDGGDRWGPRRGPWLESDVDGRRERKRGGWSGKGTPFLGEERSMAMSLWFEDVRLFGGVFGLFEESSVKKCTQNNPIPN
jgi:hypothetical protein